jgi:glycosyltransferase involved in cell wall biosynthesis
MSNNFRIDFYTNIIPPYRHALFNALGDEIQLHVHAAANAEAHRGWSDENSPSEFHKWTHDLPRVVIGNSYFYFPKFSWLKKRPSDAIVIGGWEQPANFFLFVISKLRRKRVILFYESTMHDSKYSRDGLIRLIKRAIFNWADGIITVGESSTKNALSLGVKQRHIHQGFNSIDYEWWSSKNRNRDHSHASLGTRYIYVGQLIRRKRVDLLIEAFSAISRPDDSLIIVGSGDLAEDLMSLRQNLNSPGRIDFYDSVNSISLREFYIQQDVLVLPSDVEVWGMVALEALACDVSLVISSSCGVTAEIQHLPNVLTFETKRELEFALIKARNLKHNNSAEEYFESRTIGSLCKTIVTACSQGKDLE